MAAKKPHQHASCPACAGQAIRPLKNNFVRMKISIILIPAFLILFMIPVKLCSQPTPEPERSQKIQWWRDAKFGMVIHWGLYSIPAGDWKSKNVSGNEYSEWIMYKLRIPILDYEKLAAEFNPVKFNAEEWVRIAKSAGIKYMVFVTKHHDGFCMFGSKMTNYNIVDATPYKKDPLKELSIACKKEGIKLGVYYSVDRDWHHPDAQANYLKESNFWDYPDENKKDFNNYLDNYAIPQITELLTNYGEISIFIFDDIGKKTVKQNQRIIDLIHKYQPGCIINSRLGEWEHFYYGDYRQMGDNQVSNRDNSFGWESSGTIGKSFGYNKYDTVWQSSKDLIRKLVDIVSNGGNYRLNIGPDAEGLILEKAQMRLLDIGKWMKVNSESIYGTQSAKLWQPKWGRITSKGNKQYLHVFDIPANKRIVVNDFTEKVVRVYMLADRGKKPLSFEQSYLGLTVNLPDKFANPADEYDIVIVVETE